VRVQVHGVGAGAVGEEGEGLHFVPGAVLTLLRHDAGARGPGALAEQGVAVAGKARAAPAALFRPLGQRHRRRHRVDAALQLDQVVRRRLEPIGQAREPAPLGPVEPAAVDLLGDQPVELAAVGQEALVGGQNQRQRRAQERSLARLDAVARVEVVRQVGDQEPRHGCLALAHRG